MRNRNLLLGAAVSLSLIVAVASASAGSTPGDLADPMPNPSGDREEGIVLGIPLPIPGVNVTFGNILYRFTINWPGLTLSRSSRTAFDRIGSPSLRGVSDRLVFRRRIEGPRFRVPGISFPGQRGERNAREPE